MITDAIRLFLFPALMAFAAFSDLFTMTISNRVSLLLVAGFCGDGVLTGMSGARILSHIGAGVGGSGRDVHVVRVRLDRRRRRQACGRDRALARFRSVNELSPLRLAVRRRADISRSCGSA